jgi:hypothetical protein
MRARFLNVAATAIFLFIIAAGLRADQLVMTNGDRYFGKVLSVSADTVVWDSEILGKITVPRNKVSGLAFGTNAGAPATAPNATQVSVPAIPPVAAPRRTSTNTNVDFSAALRSLGADTNFIRQVREQMLGGNPEAAGKFDLLVNGLISGKLNLEDIRREAKSSADQLRALKRDLGPEADDSLDAYLDILDSFLKQTVPAPAGSAPVSPPINQAH